MIIVSSVSLATGKMNPETSETDLLQRTSKRKGLRGSRNLVQSEDFDVPLFLELQFLNATTVQQLELHNEESEPLSQLCACVEEQTNGGIVAQAAASKNVLVSVIQDSGCTLLETSRLYDPEAVNVFGPGYLSLQVHVLQSINAISEEAMQQETVAGILASGYAITTGGHRIFLNCLNKYESFETVLSVELRRGLSAEEASPTPNPSRASPHPTRKPSPVPTDPPVAIKTESPSIAPTDAPSLPPTFAPSISPTMSPSEWPSGRPSFPPTRIPTTAPTRHDWNSIPIGVSPPVQAPRNDSMAPTQMRNPVTSDPLVIAAIAGATATVVVSCIFACCIWWRRRRSIPKRRSRAKYALSGQLEKGDPKDMIPGFVELDQRSLADTTLGERTAGWPRPKSTKKVPPKPLRPAESFDENSLYTTPFSVNRDDVVSYHQSYNGPSVLASQIIRPQEYNRNILVPLSDSATTSSDGVSSFGPASGRISTDGSQAESSSGIRSTDISQTKGPVDLDSHEPYRQKGRPLDLALTRSNERARARMVSQAIDEGSAAYDIDTWSYDFEDFDRGSDFYEAEARSRSPSHSSRSTTKMKNLSSVLGSVHRNGNEAINRSRSQASAGGESSEPYENENRRPENEMTSSNKSPESKDYGSSWSSWSARMLQDSGTLGTDDNRLGKPDERGEYRSPLSKLLDSVTQVVSPLHSNRSIPAVTPEETESDVDQPTDTSLSREDDSTLLGLQFRDEASASSNSTSMSANPWLFEKVEESLGPRSVTADMESLSGKSNLSMKSPGNRSKTGSMASYGSRKSFRSASFSHSEISFAPRTLEHDLKRLEKQLAALDSDVVSTSSAGISSITGASLAKASVSSRSRGGPKVSRKKRIVVVVPPGKLGVILANRHDGKGTVVSEIRESSPLFRMLSPGDKLIGVDDADVTNMVVSQITSLMASRADRERRLTIITSVAQQYSK